MVARNNRESRRSFGGDQNGNQRRREDGQSRLAAPRGRRAVGGRHSSRACGRGPSIRHHAADLGVGRHGKFSVIVHGGRTRQAHLSADRRARDRLGSRDCLSEHRRHWLALGCVHARSKVVAVLRRDVPLPGKNIVSTTDAEGAGRLLMRHALRSGCLPPSYESVDAVHGRTWTAARDDLIALNVDVASIRARFDEADRELRRAKLLQRPLQVVSQLWRRVEDWEDPREDAADKLLDLAQNALHIAAKSGRRDVVVETMRRYRHLGLNLHPCVRIVVAEGHADLLDALLTPGPSLDRFLRPFRWHGMQAKLTVFQCIELGDAAALKALRDVGISFFDNTSLPRSRPLETASWAGQPDAVAFILQDPSIVEYVKTGESNAIHFASRRGRASVLRVFFETGISLEHANADGGVYNLTPLQCAVLSESFETCKVLVDHGAGVDDSFPGKKLPLSIAASGGHFDILALLLARGAAFKTDVPSLRDPLEYMFDDNDDSFCSMLRLFLLERPEETKPLLLRSVRRHWLHPSCVKFFLAAGADVNQRDPDTGITPLHCFAYYCVHVLAKNPLYQRNIECIEMSLAAGAELTQTTAAAAGADFGLDAGDHDDVPSGATPIDIANTVGSHRENGPAVAAALSPK
mmetsp:Transcript_20650/g.61752  ORF Transcript_20650/g.61752 Transcript_20650/m.61752 type:complete len:635 (+) Transcript_20650:1587-3491(+)